MNHGSWPYVVEGSVKLHCTVIHSGIKANIWFLVSSSLEGDILFPIQALKRIQVLKCICGFLNDFPFRICKIKDVVRHDFGHKFQASKEGGITTVE